MEELFGHETEEEEEEGGEEEEEEGREEEEEEDEDSDGDRIDRNLFGEDEGDDDVPLPPEAERAAGFMDDLADALDPEDEDPPEGDEAPSEAGTGLAGTQPGGAGGEEEEGHGMEDLFGYESEKEGGSPNPEEAGLEMRTERFFSAKDSHHAGKQSVRIAIESGCKVIKKSVSVSVSVFSCVGACGRVWGGLVVRRMLRAP
jgi:X-linked retinitis pigmentosa GTPase regulator